MNICLIASGMSIHIRRWADFLQERGHELHILGNFPATVPGARVWNLYSKSRYGQAAYVISLRRARRLLQDIRPDIVHFHYLGGNSLYVSAARSIRPSPVIVATPWGSDVYKAGPCRKALCKRLLNRSDRILTTSTSMVSFLHEAFDQDLHKMAAYSWGVDLKLFAPLTREIRRQLRTELELPEDGFIIFSPRVMAPLYRTELIVQAFRSARQVRSDIFLVLLEGGTSGRKQLARYQHQVRTQTLDIETSVRIIEGRLAPEEIAKYYQSADCIVSTPVSDQRSSSILEALACGADVILSPIPVAFEIRQEGYEVTILPEATVDHLKHSLLQMVAVPAVIRQERHETNWKLIREAENWENQARKIEAEYEALLGLRDNIRRAGGHGGPCSGNPDSPLRTKA